MGILIGIYAPIYKQAVETGRVDKEIFGKSTDTKIIDIIKKMVDQKKPEEKFKSVVEIMKVENSSKTSFTNECKPAFSEAINKCKVKEVSEADFTKCLEKNKGLVNKTLIDSLVVKYRN